PGCEVSDGCYQASARRNRHPNERPLLGLGILDGEIWLGLARLNVEARESQGPADNKDKRSRPGDLVKPLTRPVPPGIGEDRGGDAERNHVGNRIEFYAE